jgi:LCP family protein required for cell wall assembly
MQRTRASLASLATPVLLLATALAACSSGTSPSPTAVAPTPEPTPSESAAPSLAADLLDRRWTVLYVGTDHNEGREASGAPVNTDALMLVSLSADQSELTLVSLPRDTVDVPLADGSVYPRKINGLYRDQGLDALVGAMESLFGVPIDAHVMLDMDDFASLVGAVGTIEVAPEAPLVDPKVDLDIPAGPQEIDAATANAYVRTRVDQDYGRMGRQQEVLLALVGALVEPDADVDVSTLVDSLDSLETDVPLDELPTLLELARRATDATVTRVLIEPPLITFQGDRGDGRGYVLEPDVDAIRAEVQGLIGE